MKGSCCNPINIFSRYIPASSGEREKVFVFYAAAKSLVKRTHTSAAAGIISRQSSSQWPVSFYTSLHLHVAMATPLYYSGVQFACLDSAGDESH